MSKTVLHYKRRMEAVTLRWGLVYAWRSPYHNDAIRYRIECLACRLHDRMINVGWSTPKSDYHGVLRAWSVHMRLTHYNIKPPDYPVTITDDDRRAAQQYQLRYARRVQEGLQLNKIFPD